jgi:hypothetical protein
MRLSGRRKVHARRAVVVGVAISQPGFQLVRVTPKGVEARRSLDMVGESHGWGVLCGWSLMDLRR